MQYFYSCLIKDLNNKQIIVNVSKYKFDSQQKKAIKFFAENVQTIKIKIKPLLKAT